MTKSRSRPSELRSGREQPTASAIPPPCLSMDHGEDANLEMQEEQRVVEPAVEHCLMKVAKGQHATVDIWGSSLCSWGWDANVEEVAPWAWTMWQQEVQEQA